MTQGLKRTARWKGTGMAALFALLLAGCAQEPDFGREAPTALDRAQDVVLAATGEPRDVPLPLTDAERDLRRISENLMKERPLGADGYVSDALSWIEAQSKSPTPENLRYYEKLSAEHRGSPVSLVNALGDDVAADSFEMDLFASALDDVIAADGTRAGGLLGTEKLQATVGYEGPASFARVRNRVAENDQLIEETVGRLAARLVGYRVALAHARLDAPVGDRLAVAEEAISDMEARIAAMDRGAVRHAAIMESMSPGA